ncbi:hypothetical protein D3C87_1998730 [compost metagenome]
MTNVPFASANICVHSLCMADALSLSFTSLLTDSAPNVPAICVWNSVEVNELMNSAARSALAVFDEM